MKLLSILTLVIEFFIKNLIKNFISSSVNEIIDFLFIVCFSVMFVCDISTSIKLSRFKTPLLLGYILRLFLLIWDIYCRKIFVLPNSGADSEMFYYLIVQYSQTGTSKKTGGFVELMGTLFSFIGTSRLYGQFILLLISMVSLIIFSIMLYHTEINDKIKYNICLIISVLPNFAILSSIFLRESIVSMFITVSFYMLYKWLLKGNDLNFIFAFIFAFCASRFHSGSVAVAIGYIAIILLYDKNTKTFRFRGKNIIPAVLLIFIVAFLYVNYGNKLFGKMNNVESLEDIAGTTSIGGSSYAQYVGNSNNPINMIIYTIILLNLI